MEGPTPVSALIHAATMVTAGVYLIVRTHPLFENAYVIQDLAAGLGAATLLMAGLIALVQTDIKRVIAYSTMSQIGYMFVGAGLGAYPNAMFHLMTHAFFKALLFLAAGIAIHAVVGEQDIRKLAGIGKLMPQTKFVFLIGSLALVGIFPFAGFFSKDSIIAAALDHGWYGAVIWVACIVGAFLTGLYAFRLFFIVFTGEPSAFAREHFHAHHGQEGPLSMRWTVGVLAVLVGDRRLPAVRAALASAHRRGSTRSRAVRRADEHAGVADLGDRDRRRPRGHRGRVGDLRGEARRGAEVQSRSSSTSSTGTSSTTCSGTAPPTWSRAASTRSSSGR